MDLTYILADEKGSYGQTLAIRQGEIKAVFLYWFKNGIPYAYPSADLDEIVIKIYAGVGNPVIQKKFSLDEVDTMSIAGAHVGVPGKATTDSDIIGLSFALSAVDTAALPISSTINMSVKVQDASTSPAKVSELDCPSAFNVSAPLVP